MLSRGLLRLRVASLAAYACLALSAPAIAQNADLDPAKVDNDSDGLIEIYTLEDLNNMRYDLTGASYKTSEDDAAPDDSGCPMEGCDGYELMADLDFDTSGNGRADSEDAYWNDGEGWQPIGTQSSQFTARFEGNHYVIANLFIDRPGSPDIGLFGAVGEPSTISNLGIIGAELTGGNNVGSLVGTFGSDSTVTLSYAVATVSGSRNVGGLVGANNGAIAASYALATATALVGDQQNAGGLAGHNTGTVIASYAVATAAVIRGGAGGLVGNNFGGNITASYSVATVSGNGLLGGLAGFNNGTINESYFDDHFASGSPGRQTTSALRASPTADNLYANWNVDVTGDEMADNPWNFGAMTQYPGLVLPRRADGSCPAAPAGIIVAPTGTGATARCIHRPAIPVLEFGLADQPVSTRISRNSSPSFTGRTLPGHQVRIVSVTTGAEATTPAETNGDFAFAAGTIELVEGVNRLQIYAHPSDAGSAEQPSGLLKIAYIPPADIDRDGLIEIRTLEDLNNVRYDLAGASYKTSEDATPDTEGCPAAGCNGYELMADLDFDTNGNGRADSGDAYWNAGAGWQPIGTSGTPFAARFEGNDYTIANLYINRVSAASDLGLFGVVDGARISNLGLINANVVASGSGGGNVGSLAGSVSDSTITASYALATVSSSLNQVGGLVGANGGTITASYAVATVSGNLDIGGLVGWNNEGVVTASYAVATVMGTGSSVGGLVGQNNMGDITASYALATVSSVGNFVGGLVGQNFGGDITASYAVATVSSVGNFIGGLAGINSSGGVITVSYFDADFAGMPSSEASSARTTDALQMGAADSPIYMGWDVDVDDDMMADEPWHFGSDTQYPGLKLPQLADGSCPSAPANIDVTAGTNACIHRPLSKPGFVSAFDLNEADDSAASDDDITNVRSVRVSGNITVAGMAAERIRIVPLSAGGRGVSITTSASGEFMGRVELEEGLNQFVIELMQAGEDEYGRLFGSLAIVLDSIAPTLVLEPSGDGRAVTAAATDGEAPTPSIEYQILSADRARTCQAGFSGDALMPYTAPLELSALSEGQIYCFVAADQAGNARVASYPPVSSGLRLRLRVFLESALP